MKLLHTADLHLGALGGDSTIGSNGLPKRIQIGLDVLKYVVDYGNKNCDAIIIAGDLCDMYSPSTRLLHEIACRLEITEVPIIIVAGQHELPKSKRHYHSYPILDSLDLPLTIVAEAPTEHVIKEQKFLFIPYSFNVVMGENWRGMRQYLKEHSDKDTIIVTHYPLVGAKVTQGYQLQQGLPLAVFDEVEYKFVLMGDVHKNQMVGKRIWYCGSPVYVSRAERNDSKGFYIFDTEKTEPERVDLTIEPLPELKLTKEVETKKQEVLANRLSIRELMTQQFKERAPKLIKVLEQCGVSNVLNTKVYVAQESK